MAGEVSSSTQAEISILDFIEQFYDVDARWSETITHICELLKRCATLQANIVCKASKVTSGMLIALALRCLMLTRELALAGEHFDEYCDDEGFFPDEIPVKDRRCDGSIIEISRLHTLEKDEGHTRDRIKKTSISQSLEELLQYTQDLMMRRRPQDWPILLCTLCLLHLIGRNCGTLWYSLYWHHSNRSNVYLESFEEAYETLCSLFSITSKQLHPLCNKWNKEAYSRLVGGNDVLVGTFQWMNDHWLERT